ncbi:high affinity copper uptake protein 1-like [Schistocerca cancellata]|uniref:high affinity copper uptake protein 1-like n=1 Tax=Schistocerca cancellata TaxID=274614 RepID=UPI002118CD70|nr:high affinity copper uptake protein 1-like [Schistocerca cancellata]
MSHHLDLEHHHHHHHNHHQGGDETTPSPASTEGDHGASHHGAGHQGHHGGSMHSMVMHGGYSETVLFSWWVIDSPTSLVASVLGTALLAAVFEGLKYYREYLFWRSVTAASGPERGALPLLPVDGAADADALPRSRSTVSVRRASGMLDRLHLIQTVLQALQLLLSYALMLIFMTMNVWLCFAILVGDCLGFFLFAWKRPTVIETMDTCH